VSGGNFATTKNANNTNKKLIKSWKSGRGEKN